MASITLAGVLSFVAAAGAVVGAVASIKASAEQKKQNKFINKVAAIKRQRAVRQRIAASRVQVAEQQSAGFRLGVSGSTAVQGAVAGVTSDTASSIGASNLQATSQGFIAQFQDNISSFQQVQGIAGAVTNIAGGLANDPQALEAIKGVVA